MEKRLSFWVGGNVYEGGSCQAALTPAYVSIELPEDVSLDLVRELLLEGSSLVAARIKDVLARQTGERGLAAKALLMVKP